MLVADFPERLKADSRFIDRLVELIPPKYYLTSDYSQSVSSTKYYRNTKKLNAKAKAELKGLKKQAKRSKLNPDTQKSTLDIQQERLATQEEEIKPRLKTSKVEAQSSKPETIVDLRKRLHDRIAALEQKRVGKSSIPAEAEAGSSSSKRRADLIDQRKAKKLKSKQKAQQEKMSLGAVKQNQLVASNDGAKLLANGHMVKDIQEEFDFGAIEIEGLKTKKQKADLKAALAKVEKQEQKLKGLEERDTEKAQEKKENMKWNKALSKAKGEKQQDDPKLLKKSLKRKEKLKEKSKKTWDERKDQLQDKLDQKQRKRNENIMQRKDQIKQKKTGKRRHGFEGRA